MRIGFGFDIAQPKSGGGGGFDVAPLFANGEQGVFYDRSDLTTMFQDYPATTPAAIGQPVGLMLDRRLGLAKGAELVVNGGFDSATGWQSDPGWVIQNGRAEFTQVGTGNRNVYSPTSLVTVGKTYSFEFDVVSGSGFAPFLGGVQSGPPSGGTGRYRSIFKTTANGNILVTGRFAATGSVDNISVRELLGNHAVQPTANARPTLMQDAGGRAYLYRDPTDDALPWTAPAGSYDIVHVPLTGPATVLTAQALSGATNILLAETTRAYLAINRRLTGTEIAQLQAFYG